MYPACIRQGNAKPLLLTRALGCTAETRETKKWRVRVSFSPLSERRCYEVLTAKACRKVKRSGVGTQILQVDPPPPTSMRCCRPSRSRIAERLRSPCQSACSVSAHLSPTQHCTPPVTLHRRPQVADEVVLHIPFSVYIRCRTNELSCKQKKKYRTAVVPRRERKARTTALAAPLAQSRRS